MKDFALFILSHNRVQHIDALNLIKKSNYDGVWYVVISTDNKEIEEYKKVIPPENLLIFDKRTIECDTMLSSNDFKPNAAIYARNFIIDFAKSRYKFFGMMDDDIKKIYFRININGCLKNADATPYIKEICQCLCYTLASSKHLGGIVLKNNGGYFGGIEALKCYNREIQQFMVFKSSDVRYFSGLVYEDAILSCTNIDKVYLEIPYISVLSPKEGENMGGVTYDRKKTPPSLFWYITCPSALEIIGLGGRRKRIKKNMYPTIINEKYKKL